MDIERARAFIRDQHRAVMATFRRDGSVQMSPITVGLDDDGFAVVSTREPSIKVRNLRRDPRVSVCVMNDEFYGDWVRIDGRASLVSLPEAMEPLVEYYRAIRGEHPDWDEYRKAMRDQQRVLVRIAIERAGPDRRS